MSTELPILGTDITLQGEYKGPFTSCEVANYIVHLPAGEVPTQLGVTKLIKLVYIIHGWLLGLTKGEHLLVGKQEQAEVWQSGPVYGRLYHTVSHLGERLRRPTLEDLKNTLKDAHPIDNESIEAQLIRYICKRYDKCDSQELIGMTRKGDSPWGTSYSAGSLVISNKLIENYYWEGLKPSEEPITHKFLNLLKKIRTSGSRLSS